MILLAIMLLYVLKHLPDRRLIRTVDLHALSPFYVTAYILVQGSIASANTASAGSAERDDSLSCHLFHLLFPELE